MYAEDPAFWRAGAISSTLVMLIVLAFLTVDSIATIRPGGQAFMEGQTNVWFVQGIVMRLVFGFVFAAGYVVLIYDLLTIGRRRTAAEGQARVAGGPA